MAIAQSKITSQGQISVPAEIRKRLGVGPGSAIEWSEAAGEIVVRRAGKNSSVDIHKILFPEGPPRQSGDVKRGIREYIRKKHARG